MALARIDLRDLEVSVLLQLIEDVANRLLPHRIQGCKPADGVLPVVRKGEDKGQEPLRRWREAPVQEVIVRHDRVVLGLVDAKDRHALLSVELVAVPLDVGVRGDDLDGDHHRLVEVDAELVGRAVIATEKVDVDATAGELGVLEHCLELHRDLLERVGTHKRDVIVVELGLLVLLRGRLRGHLRGHLLLRRVRVPLRHLRRVLGHLRGCGGHLRRTGVVRSLLLWLRGLLAAPAQDELVDDDLDLAVLRAVALPLAPAQLALDGDLSPLREVLGEGRGTLSEDHQVDEVGVVLPLAGLLVAATVVDGDAEAQDAGAALRLTELGVPREAPGEHDPIDGRGHGCFLSYVLDGLPNSLAIWSLMTRMSSFSALMRSRDAL